MRRTAAALVVVIVAAASCSGGTKRSHAKRSASRQAPTTAHPAPVTPTIDWKPCDDRECGTLSVPLDYAHPEGSTITLALQRTRATDTDHRIGSLLVNPGGPGASGLTFAATIHDATAATGPSGQQLAARYDYVGFDPRGIGASTPVDCKHDLDAFYSHDSTPDDATEQRALLDEVQSFANDCGRNAGAVLKFADTTDAAHDLELIRTALGDEQLHYLGFSYGTELGTSYAQQFPKRVGRLVLDGAVDPNLAGVELVRQQAHSLEQSFATFAARCAADRGCLFNSDGDPGGAFDRLITSLDQAPLRARSGRVVTQSQAVTGVATALFDRSQWPTIARVLASAERGDGSGLLDLFDAYTERRPDGTYSNLAAAGLAVNCLDYNWPRGDAGYDALVTKLRAEAPRFGEAFLLEFLPCAYWPVRAHSKLSARATGAVPILVVGTTGDPSTPYAWSQALAAALPSGVLLTRTGEGHTAYLGGNSCIDNGVSGYLLDGTPPPSGTVC